MAAIADNLTARLDAVTEEAHVVLRDVTNAPLVPKTYGSTSVYVETISFDYTRKDGAAWELTAVKVRGSRASKTGGPTKLDADESYYGWNLDANSTRRRAGDAQSWLIELGQRYLPRDLRTAAFLPAEPGANVEGNAVDLDAEV